MKNYKIKAVLALALVLVVFSLSSSLRATAREIGRVSVTGRGRVTASADRAELYLSAEGRGQTEEEAIKIRDRKAAAIEKAAARYGTVSRTSSYVGGDGCGSCYTAVFGYVLISERPNEITKAVDALLAAGASCVSEPCWLLTDPVRWEREALSQAIADAEARAAVCGAGDMLAVLHDRGSYTVYGGGPLPTVTVEATVTAVFVKE